MWIQCYKKAYLHISELVATETLPLRWGWGRFSNGLKSHWISRFQRDLKEFHPVLMTVAGPSLWGIVNQRAFKSGPKTSLLLGCLETILFSWNKSSGQQLLAPLTDHSIFRARSLSWEPMILTKFRWDVLLWCFPNYLSSFGLSMIFYYHYVLSECSPIARMLRLLLCNMQNAEWLF